MKVSVLTAITHNKYGYRPHIDNLKWALSGQNYEIYVATFKCYGLQEEENVHISAKDASPLAYYQFWKDNEALLEKILPDTDVFLFTQQDIWYTKKIQPLIQICQEKKCIVTDGHTPYERWKNPDGTWGYPRISEITQFFPAEIIRLALKENLSLCQEPRQLIKGTSFYKHYQQQINSMEFGRGQLIEFLDSGDLRENLFELSFYCAANSFPYHLTCPELWRRMFCVHFSAGDRIIRTNPGIHHPCICGSKLVILAHLLLTGFFPADEEAEQYILANRNEPAFEWARNAVKQIWESSEWMGDVYLEKLKWLKHILDK